MTAIVEPNPALMELPIEELVKITGEVHNDLKAVTFALKHRIDEARDVMTMTQVSELTGFTRTTIYNWRRNAQ